MATARADLAAFRPKLESYGAHDLAAIGIGLNPGLLDPPGDPNHRFAPAALALETGIGFYVLGKAARVTEAVRTGRLPSQDTWDDLTIYSMMARRVRATGGLR